MNYTSIETNTKFSVMLKHTIERKEFVFYLQQKFFPTDFKRLGRQIATPYDTKVETYDEISKVLRDFVVEEFSDIGVPIRLVLNEYESIFRPKFIKKTVTVILMFDDKKQYNKMKLQRPDVFQKVRTLIVGDVGELDGNG